MSRENELEIDSLRWKLEEEDMQLQEALRRAVEAERVLDEERKSVRLQILIKSKRGGTTEGGSNLA